MTADTELAERALNYARPMLTDAGNPSWATLVELPQGGFAAGPIIVARLDMAKSQADALSAVAPGALILFVGCERADRHLRFTVVDLAGNRLLRRDETQERAIGDRAREEI